MIFQKELLDSAIWGIAWMHGSSFVEGFLCDSYKKYRVSTSDIWHFFAHYLFIYLFIYYRKQGSTVSILIFQNFNNWGIAMQSPPCIVYL
jgi:hypothetical protein